LCSSMDGEDYDKGKKFAGLKEPLQFGQKRPAEDEAEGEPKDKMHKGGKAMTSDKGGKAVDIDKGGKAVDKGGKVVDKGGKVVGGDIDKGGKVVGGDIDKGGKVVEYDKGGKALDKGGKVVDKGGKTVDDKKDKVSKADKESKGGKAPDKDAKGSKVGKVGKVAGKVVQGADGMIKDGKMGKDGKKAKGHGERSRSMRAGVHFPVGRIHRFLKSYITARNRVGGTAGVFLAATMEYLCAEVLELAGNVAAEYRTKRITPRHLQLAIRGDEELDHLIKATIAGGGVIPHIDKTLLTSKKTGQKHAKHAGKEVGKEPLKVGGKYAKVPREF